MRARERRNLPPVAVREAVINDWLAVNQFTVVENRRERRPGIAREPVETVRDNVTIDGTPRENARSSAPAGAVRAARARLPAGQAGVRDPHGAGAGEGTVCRLGVLIAPGPRWPWKRYMHPRAGCPGSRSGTPGSGG